MQDQQNTEWWMWRMYREVAHLIHFPSEDNEQRLKALIAEYRQKASPAQASHHDPHEMVMDYV